MEGLHVFYMITYVQDPLANLQGLSNASGVEADDVIVLPNLQISAFEWLEMLEYPTMRTMFCNTSPTLWTVALPGPPSQDCE